MDQAAEVNPRPIPLNKLAMHASLLGHADLLKSCYQGKPHTAPCAVRCGRFCEEEIRRKLMSGELQEDSRAF